MCKSHCGNIFWLENIKKWVLSGDYDGLIKKRWNTLWILHTNQEQFRTVDHMRYEELFQKKDGSLSFTFVFPQIIQVHCISTFVIYHPHNKSELHGFCKEKQLSTIERN